MQEQSTISSAYRTRPRSEDRLRAYMVDVYNYMAGGLAVTGLVAYTVSEIPALLHLFYNTPLVWVVTFAPLVILIYVSLNDAMQEYRSGTVQTLFWVFAGLMGISMSSVFVVFTGASITRAFFISAGTFGAMSLFGYTTKKNLGSWGTFLAMGLIGIIVASVVNMFMAPSILQNVVSFIGVIVFAGLTAHDTQAIKELYDDSDPEDLRQKRAVFAALMLYIDFLNLFLQLLAAGEEGGE